MKGIHTKEDLINLKYDGHHSLSKEITTQKVDDAIKKKQLIAKESSTVDDEYGFDHGYITPCQYLDMYGITAWDG